MPSIERLREIRDAVRALANDIADREDLPTDDIWLLRDTADELDELIKNGNNMNQYRDWETDRKSTRLNSSHRL